MKASVARARARVTLALVRQERSSRKRTMLSDPGDIVARASGGEHGRGETPAQRGGVEEDRGQS